MEYWVITTIMTAVYLIINLFIGIMAAKGQVDIREKLVGWALASRRLGPVVMFFLIGAGAISAYTFLGAPGWAYSLGAPIAYVIAYLTLGYFVVYLMADKIWRIGKIREFISQAQVFAYRFESDLVGLLAALTGTIGMIGYGVVQGMGFGYLMNFCTGGRVPFWAGTILIYGVMLIYVLIAGIRGMGWTNVYQGIMMYVMAWLVSLLTIKILVGGGYHEVFTKLAEEVPESLTLAGGGWSYAFWTTAVIVCAIGIVCWPSLWIMLFSAKSIRVLKRSISLIPLYWTIIIPMIVVGWAGRLVMPGVTPADTISMEMAKASLPAWLTGIFFAAVLAAAMSSSEGLPFTAGVLITTNMIMPYVKLSEKRRLQIAKLMTVVCTVIIITISILRPATIVGVLLLSYGYFVQLFPSIIAMFYWPRATKYGVISGFIAGLIVTTLCSGYPYTHPYGIHAGMWGFIANTLALIIVSYLTKPPRQEIIQEFIQL
mgnify:CR=1 FL=1